MRTVDSIEACALSRLATIQVDAAHAMSASDDVGRPDDALLREQMMDIDDH